MSNFKLDDREIQWVGWNGENGYETLTVGNRGITKITHREQYCGENSIQWLEAWSGDKVIARFNAANVDSIHYGEEHESLRPCEYDD